eukprot:Mrub_05001.p1 GENE.Mrub_05001~~Mrub_05001.p1  ORF type:complete len:365 (+),score=22.56 Mrub_05001:103-1095(+)
MNQNDLNQFSKEAYLSIQYSVKSLVKIESHKLNAQIELNVNYNQMNSDNNQYILNKQYFNLEKNPLKSNKNYSSCLDNKTRNPCLESNLRNISIIDNTDGDLIDFTLIQSKFPMYLPYILMEYVDGLNLLTIIKHNGKIEDITTKFIFSSILECLSELQESGLNHYDLKPENILIDKNGRVKLCDLGGIADASKSSQEFKLGTHAYSAPEVIEMVNYETEKASIYTLGLILYLMVFGSLCFESSDKNDQRFNYLIYQGKLFDILRSNAKNKNLSQEFISCLEGLLSYNPNQRVTLLMLNKHQYINSLNLKDHMLYINDINKTFYEYKLSN